MRQPTFEKEFDRWTWQSYTIIREHLNARSSEQRNYGTGPPIRGQGSGTTATSTTEAITRTRRQDKQEARPLKIRRSTLDRRCDRNTSKATSISHPQGRLDGGGGSRGSNSQGPLRHVRVSRVDRIGAQEAVWAGNSRQLHCISNKTGSGVFRAVGRRRFLEGDLKPWTGFEATREVWRAANWPAPAKNRAFVPGAA